MDDGIKSNEQQQQVKKKGKTEVKSKQQKIIYK